MIVLLTAELSVQRQALEVQGVIELGTFSGLLGLATGYDKENKLYWIQMEYQCINKCAFYNHGIKFVLGGPLK